MVRFIINKIIDAIYPPRCAICDGLLYKHSDGVCSECASCITFVEEPYCMKCGKPIEDEKREYCSDCENRPHEYDEGRAALVYDEYMSRSIYRFKYNARREYAEYYAGLIIERLGRKIKSWNAQALVPVPIHKSKLKERGYNQAALIAKYISKYVNIPVDEHLVERKIPTKVMKNLNARERENNLKKAFIVNKNSVKLNTVIIIDDIYTTGSTVDAIAHLLKENGVDKVYYISLCIGRGY